MDDFLSCENVTDDWKALKAMVSSASASASSALDAEDDAVMDRRLSPCIGVVLPAESAAALSKLSMASLETVQEYEKEAAVLASSIVRLLDSSDVVTTLVASLRDSAAIKTPLPEASVRLVVYDVPASSEGARYPKRTTPPVRKEHLVKVMTAYLQSRLSHEEVAALEDGKLPDIEPNDLIFFADSRAENTVAGTALTNFMKGVQRQAPKHLNIVYSEDALTNQREGSSGASNTRGLMSLRQIEKIQLSFASLPKYEKRRNKIFEGTTVGDLFNNVGCPDLENPKDTWRLSWKEKKPLLGQASVMELARPGADGSDARSDDGIEPFNYQQRHPSVWQEVLYRFNVKAVVDLTASDGVLALVCCQERIPYVGLCNNALHASALQSRLNATVFLAMLDPKNERLHKPKLVALMSPVVGDGAFEPKPGKGRLQFVI